MRVHSLAARLCRTPAGELLRAWAPSSCRGFTASPPTAAAAGDSGSATKSRDSVVKELDEHGREAGSTGPDPSVPRGTNWHKQTVEGAMNQDSDTPPGPGGPGQGMDRRSPGGPTAEDLDHMRPTGQGGSKSVGTGGPGVYVAERLKEAAAGAWETLKHGVNNPGQPQVMEELKRTAPREAEALSNPKGSAAANQPRRSEEVGDRT